MMKYIPAPNLWKIEGLICELGDMLSTLSIVQEAVCEVYGADSPLLVCHDEDTPYLDALNGATNGLFKLHRELKDTYDTVYASAVNADKVQTE